jgi:hypothetical protein
MAGRYEAKLVIFASILTCLQYGRWATLVSIILSYQGYHSTIHRTSWIRRKPRGNGRSLFSFSKFIHLPTYQWPYSYDSCDVGTMPNQTLNGGPPAALANGDPYNGDVLSYLPGQRLSRCTCKGESHPGPVHSDGTYVGRSAPEIDIFESQVLLIFYILTSSSQQS